MDSPLELPFHPVILDFDEVIDGLGGLIVKTLFGDRLNEHAMNAWAKVQMGEANPLIELISHDETMLSYLPESELRELMDASDHVGDAPERARLLAQNIHFTIKN